MTKNSAARTRVGGRAYGILRVRSPEAAGKARQGYSTLSEKLRMVALALCCAVGASEAASARGVGSVRLQSGRCSSRSLPRCRRARPGGNGQMRCLPMATVAPPHRAVLSRSSENPQPHMVPGSDGCFNAGSGQALHTLPGCAARFSSLDAVASGESWLRIVRGTVCGSSRRGNDFALEGTPGRHV